MSIAARYHALTKYDVVNVRQGPGLDWAKQPPPFKEIVSRQRIELRRHPPVHVEAGRPVPSHADPVEQVDLPALSRLLFFANGVTGLIRYGQGGGQFLRAAPSAGALYPTEVYVAARDVPGLAPGLYSYLAATHELIRLWEDPGFETLGRACGDPEAFAALEAAVVLTGVHWRSA
ncbi:MAG: hypothetical protein OER88_01000 [Planctomycetota bacterium]|nr:hypothetical protein [Planctomycetota bacterium]